ncbi:hypothetical protein GCM10009740_16940 [Terrabacter terrae]|uniref:Uncharacterized protein n=1 Tax=Terrabacter terrae TaxID=318434 RepID=A0ABN2U2H1_9MICO
MDDDELQDTQWTDEAKVEYERRAVALIEALRSHVDATLALTGRQRELQPYFESADQVRSAARAFNDAEFDWCGSFPLALADDDEDDDDRWDDEEESEDAVNEQPMLTVFGRWDFRVIDASAAIAAGRSAYLRMWSDDTEEDASIRVKEVRDAAAEIMHADGLAGLESANGLRLARDATAFVLHEGESDEAFDEDPFAITRD